MSNIKEKLFTEFQAPTTQEWLDKTTFANGILHCSASAGVVW